MLWATHNTIPTAWFFTFLEQVIEILVNAMLYLPSHPNNDLVNNLEKLKVGQRCERNMCNDTRDEGIGSPIVLNRLLYSVYSALVSLRGIEKKAELAQVRGQYNQALFGGDGITLVRMAEDTLRE
eukprot:CAMPEP_0171582288 /NCGR_PEP_ID=MMETSP0961-20121227/10117_1 /TAXON_ID=87120 /ORGANISM="Aurantiochytrium limacinum, Strain ATCCMYA-1381" /LENGTH=124 /DNA_ID=CAMNT_0012139273 /DNA_START=270 /DNA_END=644 /DNA_ORIENTATION=+